jgi:hypothetical protein
VLLVRLKKLRLSPFSFSVLMCLYFLLPCLYSTSSWSFCFRQLFKYQGIFFLWHMRLPPQPSKTSRSTSPLGIKYPSSTSSVITARVS